LLATILALPSLAGCNDSTRTAAPEQRSDVELDGGAVEDTAAETSDATSDSGPNDGSEWADGLTAADWDRERFLSRTLRVGMGQCYCWDINREGDSFEWDTAEDCAEDLASRYPWYTYTDEEWANREADSERLLALVCMSDAYHQVWLCYQDTFFVETQCPQGPIDECDVALAELDGICGGFEW
jgi:hypothetical protein